MNPNTLGQLEGVFAFLPPPLRSQTPIPWSIFNLRPPNPFLLGNVYRQRSNKFRAGLVICRAELAHDVPFAIAIGASMLNSLQLRDEFPDNDNDNGNGGDGFEEDEFGTIMSPTDAMFAVMTIMSFLPYFNWLSWVFALMDTGKRRYAVYAIVYLAPYLRSNLSLSPEHSWLPIASIVLCLIHIQLESSIRNRDLDDCFNSATRHLSSSATRKGKEHEREKPLSLQNRIRRWGMPRKPFLEPRQSTNQEANKADANADEDGKKNKH